MPERQRTLRRTIEWSYELLDEAEQRMFCRLSVFSGGATWKRRRRSRTRRASSGWTRSTGSASLLDNSLCADRDHGRRSRASGCSRRIREFGLERLAESGEEAAIRRRHVEHWTQDAERLTRRFRPRASRCGPPLEHDHDNFRSALRLGLRSGEVGAGLRLGAALSDFWRLGGHVREGLRWLGDVLTLPGAAGSTLPRARALTAAGGLHVWINAPEVYLGFAGRRSRSIVIWATPRGSQRRCRRSDGPSCSSATSTRRGPISTRRRNSASASGISRRRVSA